MCVCVCDTEVLMWMLSKVKNHRINKNTHYNQQRMNTYIQVSGIKQDHKKKKKTTQSKRYRARYEEHIEKETKSIHFLEDW